jgi:hypothetical protein
MATTTIKPFRTRVPGIKVTQDPAKDVPAEVMAQAIVDISESMKKIASTRLTRKAIVALIHDRSGIAKRTIDIVLDNMEDLEKVWLNPRKKA